MRTCAVKGCEVRVRSDLLVCAKHWRLVPWPLRAAVNRTWSARRRRLGTPFSRAAVEAHEAAERDAREAVTAHAP